MSNGNDWIYRDDPAAQVQQGETISVWVKLAGSADGRAYFGFGATAGGTLSVVPAPNTGQFLIQQNVNYGFTDLGDVNQTYKANTWYRVQVYLGRRRVDHGPAVRQRRRDAPQHGDGLDVRQSPRAASPSGGWATTSTSTPSP